MEALYPDQLEVLFLVLLSAEAWPMDGSSRPAAGKKLDASQLSWHEAGLTRSDVVSYPPAAF
ncbi:MAG: hypothetical protein QXO30_00525 [Candidatus Caldarchaeum sp.]